MVKATILNLNRDNGTVTALGGLDGGRQFTVTVNANANPNALYAQFKNKAVEEQSRLDALDALQGCENHSVDNSGKVYNELGEEIGQV